MSNRRPFHQDQRALGITLLIFCGVILLLSIAGCRSRRDAQVMYAVTDTVVRDTIYVTRPIPAQELSVTTPLASVLTLAPEATLSLRDTTGPVSGLIRLGWTPEGLLSITSRTDTVWRHDTIYFEKNIHVVAPCPPAARPAHEKPAKPCPDKANHRVFSSVGGIGRSWAVLLALFPWTLAAGACIWLYRRFLGKSKN